MLVFAEWHSWPGKWIREWIREWLNESEIKWNHWPNWPSLSCLFLPHRRARISCLLIIFLSGFWLHSLADPCNLRKIEFYDKSCKLSASEQNNNGYGGVTSLFQPNEQIVSLVLYQSSGFPVVRRVRSSLPLFASFYAIGRFSWDRIIKFHSLYACNLSTYSMLRLDVMYMRARIRVDEKE